MFRQALPVAVVLTIVLSPSFAPAVEFSPTLKVGEQELVLNGSGAREKYFLDLYVAALYLPERNNQAASIIEADAPMAIRILITSKLVSQERLVESLQEGLEKSTGGKLQPIQAEVQRFRDLFSQEIVRNDFFDLVYVPNHGVVVLKNGKRLGNVAGLPFKQALFGIWLGQDPADADLKLALLGGTSAADRR